MTFTPALVPSNQCDGNCSFASGHASAGFFPVAMSFVWKKHRKKFFYAGIMYGVLTGFARIAQGGHFLSDVVFAGLIVYGISWILWSLYERLKKATLPKQVFNKS
jgi:lipid A 4'-phosphatase